MMAQAQKMQRELAKAHKEIDEKEFKVTKGGAVTVSMLGTKEVTEVSIDEDAFDIDNKEMVEEMLMMAVNELIEQINTARGDVNERITGRREGVGL